jgi:hypothetical protein
LLFFNHALHDRSWGDLDGKAIAIIVVIINLSLLAYNLLLHIFRMRMGRGRRGNVVVVSRHGKFQ